MQRSQSQNQIKAEINTPSKIAENSIITHTKIDEKQLLAVSQSYINQNINIDKQPKQLSQKQKPIDQSQLSVHKVVDYDIISSKKSPLKNSKKSQGLKSPFATSLVEQFSTSKTPNKINLPHHQSFFSPEINNKRDLKQPRNQKNSEYTIRNDSNQQNIQSWALLSDSSSIVQFKEINSRNQINQSEKNSHSMNSMSNFQNQHRNVKQLQNTNSQAINLAQNAYGMNVPINGMYFQNGQSNTVIETNQKQISKQVESYTRKLEERQKANVQLVQRLVPKLYSNNSTNLHTGTCTQNSASLNSSTVTPLQQIQNKTPQTSNLYFPELNVEPSRKSLSIQKKRPNNEQNRSIKDESKIKNNANLSVQEFEFPESMKSKYAKSLFIEKQSKSEQKIKKQRQNQEFIKENIRNNNESQIKSNMKMNKPQNNESEKSILIKKRLESIEVQQIKKTLKKLQNYDDQVKQKTKLVQLDVNEVNQSDTLLQIGFASKQGQSSYMNKVNQDRIIIKRNLSGVDNHYLLAAADGHGMNGHLVSKHIKQVLAQIIEFEDKRLVQQKYAGSGNQVNSIFSLPESDKSQFQVLVKQLLSKAFYNVNKQIESQRSYDVQLSGSTLLLCIVTPTTIVTANCGDSRCVLYASDGSIILETNDHKPNRPDEKQRIEQQFKGRVKRQGELHSEYRHQNQNSLEDQPYRVWAKEIDMPGLAMSRSIGDSMSKLLGVIADPEIQILEYSQLEKSKQPHYVALASDGIWDVLESKELASLIIQSQNQSQRNDVSLKSLKNVVSNIVKDASDLWVDVHQQDHTNPKNSKPEIDDISLILGIFNHSLN